MKQLKRIFAIFTILFAFCMPAVAETNVPHGDVGDFGEWSTPVNQQLFKNNLIDDINSFQGGFQTKIQVKDYVPVEAKVGRAFIGAMSLVGEVLERSLVRFVTIFMIGLFAFWAMFEAYQLLSTGGDARKTVEAILKKGILITIWVFIIEQGPAQLFMWIMGPIIGIGTYLSDLILNSVTTTVGASLPDTCAAIHDYAALHHTGREIIDASATADLLCVPTRLSGFFYTAVSAGWQWMIAGIGNSAFTFTAGAIFVVIFIYNIWKFALMALGVIADLFLGIFMLPFTAIAMTFGASEDKAYFGESGATSYKGIAGNVFNQFMKLFTTETVSKQVDRFINAMLYFVSLSVVVAVCAAILSGVVDVNMATEVPTLKNDGFMTTLIVGCLVAYLANKAGDFAKKIGGTIDDSYKYRDQIAGDIKNLWGNTTKTVKSWYKAATEKKK